MSIESLLISKCPFQDEAMPEKTALFQEHCQQVPKAHYCQAEIEGLTATKINVFHLILQFEALIILFRRPTALMQRSYYFQASN